MLSKVKFIEDELNSEFYDILREEESKDDLPSVVPEVECDTSMITEEYRKKQAEDEIRIAEIKKNAEERARELDTLD